MAQSIRIFLPTPEEGIKASEPCPRIPSLKGMTIGLIDNGWRSLAIIYDEYSKLLRDEKGVKRVIHQKKASSSPLPRAAFEEFATQADAVISGLGN